MEVKLDKCTICPHMCKVNRELENKGICGAGSLVKVAKVAMYYFEEPCISGCGKCGKTNGNFPGSGTIFFSNCNLNCVFCQNYKISQEGFGKEITIEKLANIMVKLQHQGAYNINLVTPTIYALQIKEAIILAKDMDLTIPIIYNSSGYENIDTLKLLDGLIDVYLPDMKYFDNEIAFRYSKVKNYFDFSSLAILEMYKQVGKPVFNENGMITNGIIIRHMILPNCTRDSKKILYWIKDNIGVDSYISLMAQYFPTNKSYMYESINRKITTKELKIVENYMYSLGFFNGYVQNIEKNEDMYVPNFNLDGI